MYVVKQIYKPCNCEAYMDGSGVFWNRVEDMSMLRMTRELAIKLVAFFRMMDIAGGEMDYAYSVENEEDVCTR